MISKSGGTNRIFLNFCEYALKSSENQRFSSPKFFPKEKTFLNANIMRNFCLRKNSNPRGSQIILQPRVEINKQNGGIPKWRQNTLPLKARRN